MKNFVPVNLEKEERVQKVIKEPSLTLKDEDAVIALYEQLVSDSSLVIDLPLIVHEGFKAFESTIGKVPFKKLKRYFGIECNKSKCLKSNEVAEIIGKMRTVENAQFYICNFKELISIVASRIYGAPEYMSDIVKAKMIMMYFTIFINNSFLQEDMADGTSAVSWAAVKENRFKIIYPERLFYLYENSIEMFEEKSIMYDMIVYELNRLDERLREEVLEFAELKCIIEEDEERFVSVNQSMRDATFGNIRNIKKKIFAVPVIMEPYRFSNKTLLEDLVFDDMYKIYKAITQEPFESKPVETVKRVFLEGEAQNVVQKPIKCRVLYKEEGGIKILAASKDEVDRIVFAFETAAKIGLTMKVLSSPNEKGEYSIVNAKIGIFLGAIKFATSQNYLDNNSSKDKDYEVSNALTIIGEDVGKSHDDDFMAYMREEITAEELKKRLKIDSEFEQNVLGIEKEETMYEAAIRFAKECGYITEDSAPEKDVINQVFKSNEAEIKKFAKGEIDSETLKERIGFDEEFAKCFFDLKQVDMTAIEAKLQTLKKERAGKHAFHKIALLINLYCYLVQEQVKCGPKNKVPKGNKNLKPKNLLAMIA